jgi:hypothetical protein
MKYRPKNAEKEAQPMSTTITSGRWDFQRWRQPGVGMTRMAAFRENWLDSFARHGDWAVARLGENFTARYQYENWIF